MSARYHPEDFNIPLSIRDQKRLGANVGRILLHATTKQAEVDDLDIANSPLNPNWTFDSHNRTRPNVGAYIKKERARQEIKLAWRKYDAELLLGLGMILSVSELIGGVSTTGEPSGLDLRAATLTLATADGEESVDRFVTYAETLPIPGEFEQSYLGHRLTVEFDVLSIPRQNRRYLA